jgi:hypothetical protein
MRRIRSSGLLDAKALASFAILSRRANGKMSLSDIRLRTVQTPATPLPYPQGELDVTVFGPS